MIAALIVFALVLAIILIPYLMLVARPEGTEQRQLKKRLKASAESRHRKLGLLKQTEPLSSVDAINNLLLRAGRTVDPIRTLLEQAGTRMTVGSFVLLSGCTAGLGFFLVHFFTRSLAAAAAAGALAGALPYMWVRRKRTKRVMKFEELFPEAVDLITRALRAGHTFQTGLSMVAEELPEPVGGEFRLLFDRQNFGMPLPEALRSFAERIPLLDAKFFATAVLTQREAGGNLAEVLDNLSTVIRERFKVKRQVRVISAHGRITGWVLAALPPVLSIVFLAVSPKHLQTLFNDPLGVQFIIAALVLQGIGTLAIRKIVNIEY